jgi:VIT family
LCLAGVVAVPGGATGVGPDVSGHPGSRSLQRSLTRAASAVSRRVGLVVGVAGATAEQGPVLVAGLAGLVAGALSMAGGEYVPVRTQSTLLPTVIRRRHQKRGSYPSGVPRGLLILVRPAYRACPLAAGSPSPPQPTPPFVSASYRCDDRCASWAACSIRSNIASASGGAIARSSSGR